MSQLGLTQLMLSLNAKSSPILLQRINTQLYRELEWMEVLLWFRAVPDPYLLKKKKKRPSGLSSDNLKGLGGRPWASAGSPSWGLQFKEILEY